MSLRRALLPSGLALGLLACATPTLRPLPADDPRPAVLLERWSAAVADRHALRGVVRLAVDAQRLGAAPLRLRSKQRVVMARPARLRVEVQGFLGTTLAVLAVDEGRYAFLETEGRRFESGAVYPTLLRDLVGLDLPAADAVDLVLGIPTAASDLQIRAAFDAGDGITRVELEAEGAVASRRTLDFDGEARLRRWATRSAEGEPLWEARVDAYAPVAGSPVAHRVRLELPTASAVLRLSGVELNPALEPGIFQLEPIASAAEGG